MEYKECKFYIDGKCSHIDAPEPYKSGCIGKEYCGTWEDNIEYKAMMKPIQRILRR